MKFTWIDKNGEKHIRFICGKEERLQFIEWLENSKEVVIWW